MSICLRQTPYTEELAPWALSNFDPDPRNWPICPAYIGQSNVSQSVNVIISCRGPNILEAYRARSGVKCRTVSIGLCRRKPLSVRQPLSSVWIFSDFSSSRIGYRMRLSAQRFISHPWMLAMTHTFSILGRQQYENLKALQNCNTQKLSIRHTKFEFLEMTSPWVCFNRQNLKDVLQVGFKFRQVLSSSSWGFRRNALCIMAQEAWHLQPRIVDCSQLVEVSWELLCHQLSSSFEACRATFAVPTDKFASTLLPMIRLQ